jgi:hypothetical protein
MMHLLPDQGRDTDDRECVVSREAMIDLAARAHELGVDGFGVMHYLFSVLKDKNEIPASATQTAIAVAIDMPPSRVNRAFKRLIKIGVLVRDPHLLGDDRYRISPLIAWKGTVADHWQANLDHRMKTATHRGVV